MQENKHKKMHHTLLKQPYLYEIKKKREPCPFNLANSGTNLMEYFWKKEPNAKKILESLMREAAGDNFYGQSELLAEIPVKSENIIVSNGVSNLLYDVFALFREEGDILFESPCYPSFCETAKFIGTKFDFFFRNPDFSIDTEHLLSKVNESTKLIVISDPNNPAMAKIVDLFELLDRIAKKNPKAFVVLDCIYAFHDKKFSYFEYENLITLYSLSKIIGQMPRAGWAIFPSSLIEKVQNAFNLIVNSISPFDQYLAASVLKNIGIYTSEANRITDLNRKFLLEILADGGFDGYLLGEVPKIGTTWFAEVKNVKDTMKFSEELFNKFGVGVVAGEYFGWMGYFRIGLGQDPKNFEFAIRKLRDAIKEILS